ncbi:MAG: ABC transporter permease [Acidimicrobiia bacterium]|nr:ABC transporter permease [Acidimicrobiia bacterium]
MTAILLLAAGAVVAVLGGFVLTLVSDTVRRPSFRRLAVRNIVRRPGEAALVVAGAMLGTAIITASLIMGDTVERSIADDARTDLGPLDVAVRSVDEGRAADLAAAWATSAPTGITDVTLVRSLPVVVTVGEGSEVRGEPAAVLVEADLDVLADFGGDRSITGFADHNQPVAPGSVLVNETLADDLGLRSGDTLTLHAVGTSIEVTVDEVVNRLGVAGHGPTAAVGFALRSPAPIFVAPGTIDALVGDDAGEPDDAGATPPAQVLHEVWLSTGAGVFVDPDQLTAAGDAVDAAVVDDPDLVVRPLKANVLEAAARNGAALTELYASIGGFSVLAGILLLVNLFVMLSEERKTELGMLRAVGVKRNQLLRVFGLEGAIYSLAAAVLGAVVGIAVGAAITGVAARLVAAEGAAGRFELAVHPSTLATGAAIGLTISLVTVLATSGRIARLNVIRAIRDLPEPPRRPTWRGTAAALVGVGVGLVLLAVGLAAEAQIPTLVGVPVAALSAIPLLGRRLPTRVAIGVPAAVALAWGASVFALLPGIMGDLDFDTFVLQGVILVAAGVAVASVADRVWARLARAGSGTGVSLPLRLGLAYPLARRLRSALLLAMYSLVIFTMTLLSLFAELFAGQAPTFTREVSAGYDLYVDSSAANPVATEELVAIDGVEAVATLRRALPFWEAGGLEAQPWPMSGIDDAFVARGPEAVTRWLPELGSRQDAYRAVLDDPTLVLVPDFFLQRNAGPPTRVVELGDTMVVRNTATGEERRVVVAGLVANDWVGSGVLAGDALVEELMGATSSPNRHYVAVAPGIDPEAVAGRINGTLLASGADATTFAAAVDRALATNLGFFTLLRAYLGLGLLIGIAGLGVVMVRAVRERRREIGMLRAMGVSSRTVRRAFLFEAAFVSLQGSLLGVGLGTLVAWQFITSTEQFGTDNPFAVPYAVLGLILVVPIGASLLATLAPARAAARVAPAAALRVAD